VAGDFSCEEVDVGGVAEVRGNCDSKTVTINGKFEVSGSLSASETLDSFGSGDIAGDFHGGDLHVGGRFKARKAVLENSAEIAGEIETEQGTKAKSVVVGSGSKCRGPLVGERVELSRSKMVWADWSAHWAGQVASLRLIGRMTSAEDVYGDEVVLGPNTRCRNVFAKTVELGPGCVVEKVTYTQELRRGHHPVHETRPSEKTDKLPPSPL
jgi:cytoskeletal protein CcmA (bactofilin family)